MEDQWRISKHDPEWKELAQSDLIDLINQVQK